MNYIQLKSINNNNFNINNNLNEDIYQNKKFEKKHNGIMYSSERKLNCNNFDPAKYSPKLFIKKLEYRIKNYYLEQELNNDILKL